MAPVPEPIQKHVPAWKKLGLKLKFAKEEPDGTRPRQNGIDNLKKRKAPAEEDSFAEYTPTGTSTTKSKKSEVRAEEAGKVLNGNGTSHEQLNKDEPRKKVKESKSRSDESAEAGNGNKKTSKEPRNVKRPSKKAKESKDTSVNSKSGDTYEQESSPSPALKTTPASKGKSVSFTPDTKTGDGDSIKGLYKTWIAKQIATDPSFDPSTVSPALRSIIPSTVASLESPSPVTSTSPSNSDPTARDNQKPTKKKKTRLPKTSSGSDPSRFDPVLTYLTSHHTSPQTWKFSKPQQNQVLKHLFSLRHIPPSYDSALLPYIRGLKGTFARSRVRRAALAVREEDDKWLASEPLESEKMDNETAAQCNTRRRRDYEAAVARIKQTLKEREDEREERDAELLGENEEWEQRCWKRRRAEIVLWGVGEEQEKEDEDEVLQSHTSSSPRQDTVGGIHGRQMDSGMAQLARAAVRDPGPAPRAGRGVGMGMGGVEVIDAGGIARGSQAKKLVFTAEDGTAQPVSTSNKMNGSDGSDGVLGRANEANGVRGIKRPNTVNGANGLKPKRNRKRRRRTGVPDDDDSSSSSESSSSSSSSSDEEEQQRQKMAVMQPRAEKSDSRSYGTSSSSSDDSDSDSE